jgi:hypothetical protein
MVVHVAVAVIANSWGSAPIGSVPSNNDGATFATIHRALIGGCGDRDDVPIDFEEPDLVGSCPRLVPRDVYVMDYFVTLHDIRSSIRGQGLVGPGRAYDARMQCSERPAPVSNGPLIAVGSQLRTLFPASCFLIPSFGSGGDILPSRRAWLFVVARSGGQEWRVSTTQARP